MYKVDWNTIVYSMVYLNSNMEADTASVYEIQVHDTDTGFMYHLDCVVVPNKW